MNNTQMIWNFILSLVALIIGLMFDFKILFGWSIGMITMLCIIYLNKIEATSLT